MMGNPIAGLPKKDVGVAFMWELLNRGKRCIGVDVSTDGRPAGAARSGRHADVFVTNLLPGARARFRHRPRRPRRGQSRPDLRPGERATAARGRNATPAATTTPISGRAPASPTRRAWSPTSSSRSRARRWATCPPGRSWRAASRRRCIARVRTGRGALVDVSLLSSGMWVGAPAVIASQLYGVDTIPADAARRPAQPARRRVRHQGRPADLSGRDRDRGPFRELLRNHRPQGSAGRSAVRHRRRTGWRMPANASRVLDEIFAGRDLAEWLQVLPGLTTPWTVVQTAAEAAIDPQVVANDLVAARRGRRRGARSRWCGRRPNSMSYDPRCGRRPTTASTPMRCCSSSAAAGTRSSSSRRVMRSSDRHHSPERSCTNAFDKVVAEVRSAGAGGNEETT